MLGMVKDENGFFKAFNGDRDSSGGGGGGEGEGVADVARDVLLGVLPGLLEEAPFVMREFANALALGVICGLRWVDRSR